MEAKKREAQCAKILKMLKGGRQISVFDFPAGTRLGGRVYDLRHGKFDGKKYRIDTTIKNGVAVYSMKKAG